MLKNFRNHSHKLGKIFHFTPKFKLSYEFIKHSNEKSFFAYAEKVFKYNMIF